MDNVFILRRRRLGKTSTESIKAFSSHAIGVHRNDENTAPNDPDALCIRWGCTSNVGTKKVVNTAKGIHAVNNKREFRRLLNDHGLCPKTWTYFDKVVHAPVIVRPHVHAQGRNLYVCNNLDELLDAIEKCKPHYYISEVVDKVAEYRVFVVQGRVACVAKKTPGNPNDIAWNVARGGRFDNVRWGEWDLNVCHHAIEAMRLVHDQGLTFGGVDVMIDNEGRPYVIEINSAPSLTSPYRQKCMAKCFDHIIEHGKDWIETPRVYMSWKDVIHPAVRG